MPAEARPAATVLLLRDDTELGLEVFMVQRHRKSGFMPSAWVFPGGRVDDRDRREHARVLGGRSSVEQMEADPVAARAFLVAAVRETFEEAGVLIGDGELPEAVREPLARGALDLGDLLESHQATVDLDQLAPWSWWVTPEQEPRRYDTRFLLARAPTGTASHDDRETVDSGWVRPEWALEQGGSFPLAPPTWWTLRELAAFSSVDAVFSAVPQRTRRAIQPILHLGKGGVELVLPGHAQHPDPSIPGLPSAIGFDQGRWWTR
ncbi:MAG: NUDIX hydrolase [Proteobacteria bacterium]|nr:NUDIX hydrolase [Pseudomonadota bacterium]